MRSNNKRLTWDRSDSKSKRKRNKRLMAPLPQSRMQIYSRAGTQLLRDVNMLRRYINTELHYIDATASTTATTTPTLVLLNGCATGDTATTRTGQSIKMDRTDLRFQCSVNATSIINYVRIIAVVDRQPNAAAMTAADLLVSNTPYSPYTFGSQQRFVPLYDETFALSTYGPGALTRVVSLATNQHVTFNTVNGGTIADIVSNSVYLLFLSDQVANPPALTYYSRLWFVDN